MSRHQETGDRRQESEDTAVERTTGHFTHSAEARNPSVSSTPPLEAVKQFGPPMNADKRGFKRTDYQRSSALIRGLMAFFLTFLRPGLGANAATGLSRLSALAVRPGI
jgi:hypothetical protein